MAYSIKICFEYAFRKAKSLGMTTCILEIFFVTFAWCHNSFIWDRWNLILLPPKSIYLIDWNFAPVVVNSICQTPELLLHQTLSTIWNAALSSIILNFKSGFEIIFLAWLRMTLKMLGLFSQSWFKVQSIIFSANKCVYVYEIM